MVANSTTYMVHSDQLLGFRNSEPLLKSLRGLYTYRRHTYEHTPAGGRPAKVHSAECIEATTYWRHTVCSLRLHFNCQLMNSHELSLEFVAHIVMFYIYIVLLILKCL